MNILVTTTFPMNQSKEISERFVNLPPLPEFIKSKNIYIRHGVGEGVKITTIYDIEDAKFAEAYKYVFRFMNSFHNVPGLTFSIEVCLAPDEALETIKDVIGVDLKQKG